MAEWKKIIVSGSNAVVNTLSAPGGLSGPGGSITSLDASNISTGTLSNGRLPSAIDVTSVTGSFKGNLAGNASTATSATSAATATNVTLAAQGNSGNYPVVFAQAATGDVRLYSDAGISYNPATDVLTVTTIAGNLSGTASSATTASYAATAPYSGLTGTVPTWNQNTTGNAATATTASYATTAATATSATTATNATNLNVAGSTTNTAYPIPFVAGADGNVRAYTDTTAFTFNPGTNTLGVSAISAGSITVSGDLTVNGNTTILSTTNTEVEDRFMILNVGSGSVAPAGEGGIIVEGSTANQGEAFYYDGNSTRWSIASSVSKTASSVTPAGYIAAVYDAGASQTAVAAIGNIKVDSGDIYIYA